MSLEQATELLQRAKRAKANNAADNFVDELIHDLEELIRPAEEQIRPAEELIRPAEEQIRPEIALVQCRVLQNELGQLDLHGEMQNFKNALSDKDVTIKVYPGYLQEDRNDLVTALTNKRTVVCWVSAHTASEFTDEMRVQAEQQAEEIFKSCNANQYGKIEWKEVMAKCGTIWTENEAKVQEIDFLSSDRNGTGMIDKNKLKDQILNNLAIKLALTNEFGELKLFKFTDDDID